MAITFEEWKTKNTAEIQRIASMVPFVNEQQMMIQFLDAGLREYSAIADFEEVISAHRDELNDCD